ncbi:MAG: ATP-binding protein, partial [Pseudobdellovibrionaceae bacterium]
LANMSHEIRTPLNAILGFTDLMLDPHLSFEERTNAISIVRRNGHQLLKIIDEILDISKVESGKMDIESIETEVLNVLSGVRSLMNVTAIKKKINLQFSIENKIPKTVISDPTRLRQVLINVVGNAIKFTEKGSVSVSAKYERKNSQDYLLFKIEDTGLGLDMSLAEKIFTPFSQADCSTTRIYGGTGLGLTLSRRLARALGGDVWLESSELGKGSIFFVKIRVEIPLAIKWVSRFSDINFDETASLKSAQMQRLKGKKILVVEDAKDNQILIGRFLQGAGAEIDIANNGEEGVAKALSNDYEAILMDIQMPLLDGYEATSRLRSQGYSRPIIALTAHALKEEKEKCLFVGCDEHLTKPIDRNVLIDSLQNILSTNS